MNNITLKIHDGVEIHLNDGSLTSTGLKDPCPHCHKPDCYQHVADDGIDDCPQSYEDQAASNDRRIYNAAIDGLESLVLAQHQAGLDLEAPAYLEALRTAVDAITNHLA